MGALDTNILVYSEGLAFSEEDDRKVVDSIALLKRMAQREIPIIVAAQALAELHYVLIRRGRMTKARAEERLRQITANIIVVPTTADLLARAFELAARHNLPTFDSIILAAAAEARCDVLYSEDFQPGFSWRGVEVVNPFA